MSPQRAEDATPGLAHCGAEPGDDADMLRHARHLMLPGWGFEAQSQLRAAHALVIGAGGLGSPALMYLAAAGVGTLSVVDADSVELSNLQRQILHRQGDLGRLKVDSARRGLLELNPTVTVHTWAQRADSAWLEATVPQADVVLDCSDNFQTRQAVNAACRRHGKVLVSASALG